MTCQGRRLSLALLVAFHTFEVLDFHFLSGSSNSDQPVRWLFKYLAPILGFECNQELCIHFAVEIELEVGQPSSNGLVTSLTNRHSSCKLSDQIFIGLPIPCGVIPRMQPSLYSSLVYFPGF